jgi:hypothetical protein
MVDHPPTVHQLLLQFRLVLLQKINHHKKKNNPKPKLPLQIPEKRNSHQTQAKTQLSSHNKKKITMH